MSDPRPLLPLASDAAADADPRVRAVFDDIRAVRKTDLINNFWRAFANDPAALERTWAEVKAVMGDGALDPLTKELVYIAVSVTNGCEYCIRSHTAGARAKGLDDAGLAELLSVIALANKTNALVNGLRPPVDEAFR